MGVILAVIFGAANAYLGLRVGMTVSASIPAAVISVVGGLIGVLFMVPLRNALIVKEHGVLPYPEGTACSEVLLAGEEGGASAIWSSYIRYIGAGAVAAGGIISLCKTFPLIIATFRDAIKGLKGGKSASNLRTD